MWLSFLAGHIKGAISLTHESKMRDLFFGKYSSFLNDPVICKEILKQEHLNDTNIDDLIKVVDGKNS